MLSAARTCSPVRLGLLLPLTSRPAQGAPPVCVRKTDLSNASCRFFRVWGRHSWRFGANEGLHSKLVSVPHLTWDTNAAYSSLRRKKRHSLSGDIPSNAQGVREQLCRAGPSFLVGLESSPRLVKTRLGDVVNQRQKQEKPSR
jgi:hypothetical protein